MLVVRPVAQHDLDDVFQLALKAGQGMTSLPPDKSALQQRIALSEASFKRQEKHMDDFFLLVMEDQQRNKVVGTAGVYAMTGARQAFYAYRIMAVTHHSHSLNKQVHSPVLHLTNDYSHCSEVGALFLDPAYRGNGHWLARSRYLLMGLFRERFADAVIAELRGWTDNSGRSPFWDAIGRHFFQMSFDDADKLCGMGSNQFITELMPKYPIYTSLLPDDAQQVLGKPADAGQRAQQLLEREGFHYDNVIDIFDAGPLMRASIAQLKSVSAIRYCQTKIIDQDPPDQPSQQRDAIIANPDWHNFRVITAPAPDKNNGVVLSGAQLQALHLSLNDEHRLAIIDGGDS